MNDVYHVGDLHLFTRNICNFRRQFSSMEEHDDYVINCIESCVTKSDTLYLHGDIFPNMESVIKYLPRLLACTNKIVLIPGNHDFERCTILERKQALTMLLVSGVDVRGFMKGKRNVLLSHEPIHIDEMRKSDFNIHAHMHENFIVSDGNKNNESSRYFCCSIDNSNINYNLKTRKQIDEIMAKRR